MPELHQRYIDEKMTENDELTAAELMDCMFVHFGSSQCGSSVRTLARARHNLGWTFSTVQYCQAIPEGNKAKRLEWCKERLANSEQFDNVIFTDEFTIQLDEHRTKSYRKKGAARKLKCKHKHLVKIHVWAGISKRGAMKIVMFDGILTAVRYADILTASLLLFICNVSPCGHCLYQDNYPKHMSRYIRDYFSANNVNWWKSSAERPDLNLIEIGLGITEDLLAQQGKAQEPGRT